MIVVGAMTSGGTSASEVTNESCAASELVKRVAFGRHGSHREGVGAALVEFRQDDRTVSGGRHLPAVDRELIEFRFGHFGPGDDGFRRIGAAERDLRLGKLLQIVQVSTWM